MLNEFRSTSITWDKATRRIYSPITANASDSNGRKLNIQVVNSGQVESLTGTTLHLYWETKDKSHYGLDAFNASDISKGEFELFYTTGMLSNVGELNATLVLVDSTGKVVSDWFKITVTRGINEDAIESENSFSSLTQALIDISDLEQNYAPTLNDLTAHLQQTKYELQEDIQSLDSGINENLNNIVKHRPIIVGQNVPTNDIGTDGTVYLQTYGESDKEFYEEGSFTPSIYPVTEMTVSYSEQTGYFVRYGNMVHITLVLGISSITVEQATGGLSIDGLPYAAARTTGVPGGIISKMIPTPDYNFSGGLFVAGFNRISMQQFNPTTGERLQARLGSLKAGSVINLEFTYQVNVGDFQ